MRFFIHLKKLVVWQNRPEKFPMHNVLPTNLSEGSQQELLDVIERERSIRTNPSRNTLPISATDIELEELIIQHLATAAAMGRARQIGQRSIHIENCEFLGWVTKLRI